MLRAASLLLAFLLPCFPCPTAAQDQPADAAELSRDLLYHPALRIEPFDGGLCFRAAQFTYEFVPASGQWTVRREANFRPSDLPREIKTWRDPGTGAEFRFAGSSTDDEGILEIRRAESPADQEPLARLVLWNRKELAAAWLEWSQRENRSLTEERFLRDLEVADPEVAAVAQEGSPLWLAIRYYAGEGVLGIGTLVRLDPATGETAVVQPPELATSSITHIVAAGGALWLGTWREGEDTIEPTAGLVRFDPATGEVKSFLRQPANRTGSIVTALYAAQDTLWVASDEGICRLALPAEDFHCWEIVPTVRVAATLPVSNRPGGPARRRLRPGRYEVRWANEAFLEVVTPDAMEGWIDLEELEEYAGRKFDARPFELANAYGGGAGVMRLLEKPEGDPLSAAQVYRAVLEEVGSPDEEDWQRVRAHVGWIRRQGLEVTPAIRPAGQ